MELVTSSGIYLKWRSLVSSFSCLKNKDIEPLANTGVSGILII